MPRGLGVAIRHLATWRAELDERMAQLKKLRDTLDDCIGCGCLSIGRCQPRNPYDELAKQGPGPHRLWVKRGGSA